MVVGGLDVLEQLFGLLGNYYEADFAKVAGKSRVEWWALLLLLAVGGVGVGLDGQKTEESIDERVILLLFNFA